VKDPTKLSHRELAAFVCEHLQASGIDTVLTGGACVTILTSNSYESCDLDFVNVAEAPLAKIEAALLRIGFVSDGRIYVNKKVKYSIDILNPPLAIGAEKITATNTITVKKMHLKMLTPTDSVRDRLAAFYFWNDLQALEQALMVARDNDVDLAVIRRWSKKENESEKFKLFKKKLRSSKK
jgi:hypothetical protein